MPPESNLHSESTSRIRTLRRFLLLSGIVGAALFLSAAALSLQQTDTATTASAPPPTNPSCDDTSGMSGMSVMGESMMAMMTHMCVTPMRPPQPGDEDRARAIVAQVKATMEKYKDYKKAIKDGYLQANPSVDQPQFHFNNAANIKLADTAFDPTRPSALLYRRTPQQRFKLEGVMFTDRVDASADDLDKRIPLSVARWHRHTNFCAAPANKTEQYLGANPKFGMFGSLHTKEACQAEGGTFYPVIFNWMIHVFPYEDDFKNVFSMNDDIAHVH